MCDKVKKNRGTNFNKEEELLLVEEVFKQKHIIECKTTNKISISEKARSWDIIAKNFNSKSFQNRSSDQLKAKFDNLKTKARKMVASEGKYAKGTGGGPFLGGGGDPILDAVLNIINMKTVIGVNYAGDSNCFPAEYTSTSTTANTNPVQNENTTDGYREDYIQTLVTITEQKEDDNKCEDEVDVLDLPFSIEGLSQRSHPPHIRDEDENIISQDNMTSEIKHTPKAPSLKRAADSDWNNYVPRKLKEPVAKKLRPTVKNPLYSIKQEYYSSKLVFLQGEIQRQKQVYEMAEKEEERRKEEHALRMKILELEYQKALQK